MGNTFNRHSLLQKSYIETKEAHFLKKALNIESMTRSRFSEKYLKHVHYGQKDSL